MFTKWRISGWRLVVQGSRPSRALPISHLVVSAPMSRVTCSWAHVSTQAWKRLCSRGLLASLAGLLVQLLAALLVLPDPPQIPGIKKKKRNTMRDERQAGTK
ncbi:hypothetical protein EYF80_009880 [Liparis tanakae]|uniref:Uncharacterized protein n=1 Tax=Liparis tanakae TaxID=230148 RepID=A0A4Z2IRM2_9TELE|nr:hypothetical protein EYF80_009880 [Liparis tanakae]